MVAGRRIGPWLLAVWVCVALAAQDDPGGAADPDSGGIAAEEQSLEKEAGALKNEEENLEGQDVPEDKDAKDDGPKDAAGRTESSFTKLVTCQKKVDFEIEQAKKYDETGTSCKSRLAQADLDVVTQQRKAQTSENLRHKAKLEEEDALRQMQKSLDLHKKEYNMREVHETSCKSSKAQLQSAHLHTMEAVKVAIDLHAAQIKGAAAKATSTWTNEKLKIIESNAEEMKSIREKIEAATDKAVKLEKSEADSKVESALSQSKLDIEKVEHDSEMAKQSATVLANQMVNKTKMEADEAVKSAEKEQAFEKRTNFKAWAEQRLNAALAAVKRSTDASKMVAMMVANAAKKAEEVASAANAPAESAAVEPEDPQAGGD